MESPFDSLAQTHSQRALPFNRCSMGSGPDCRSNQLLPEMSCRSPSIISEPVVSIHREGVLPVGDIPAEQLDQAGGVVSQDRAGPARGQVDLKLAIRRGCDGLHLAVAGGPADVAALELKACVAFGDRAAMRNIGEESVGPGVNDRDRGTLRRYGYRRIREMLVAEAGG